MLFVIIPTRQAEAGLARLLPQLAGVRVIVADSGSVGGAESGSMDSFEDAVLTTALAHGAQLALGASGRGAQLRLGGRLAMLCSGPKDWFLFLHADCVLPEDWRTIVADAIAEGDPCYFRFRADASGPKAWLMDRLVALRNVALGLPYGDQGLLVSRALYDAVGGYAPMPLFEDVDLVRRLRRHARLKPLPAYLRTDVSAHWRDGLWRRGTRNLRLLWRYWRGADVDALLRDYRR